MAISYEDGDVFADLSLCRTPRTSCEIVDEDSNTHVLRRPTLIQMGRARIISIEPHGTTQLRYSTGTITSSLKPEAHTAKKAFEHDIQ